MLYSPHLLFRKTVTTTRDEHNRTVAADESWVPLGLCRCDDNTTTRIKDAAGQEYSPMFHIVASKGCEVEAGDVVRVLDGCYLRGEGKVTQVKRLSYLNYTDIYV